MQLITASTVQSKLPAIRRTYNKFDRGRLFLAAGSYGMAGAAIMAAEAALRSGVGYLDLFVPKSIYPIVAQRVPEAVYSVYDETDAEEAKRILLTGIAKADAVAAGPGLGSQRAFVTDAILSSDAKTVLFDADSLNRLSELRKIPKIENLMLTPHEGEAGRLLGVPSEIVKRDRIRAVSEIAAKYRASVLLKGPETLIVSAASDEIYVNRTGNAGLSRAGSGDVLTGIAGCMAAAGCPGLDPLLIAAFVHGEAAERIAEVVSVRCMLPTDLTTVLSAVFSALESETGKEERR